MKNLLPLTLAALLLLSLTACGEAPAQGSGSAGASADSSQAAPPAAEPGPVTTALYNKLSAIRLGEEPDTHGWNTILD